MRRLLPDPAELDDAGLVEAYRLPPGRSLRVNFVASLDGAVTVGGVSEGLGSPGDQRVFRILRALSDVEVSWDDEDRWLVVHRGSLRVVANLADAPREVPLDRPATGVLFATGDQPGIDRGTVTLPAETAVVLTT